MDEKSRRLVLARLLDELGLHPEMSDFDSRLRLQKAGYLLESMGVPFQYGHSWYVRGPYSPMLADDLFAIAGDEQLIQASRQIALSGQNEHLLRLKDVLANPPVEFAGDITRWFEALGSARYLTDVGYGEKETEATLNNTKGLSAAQVGVALAALGRVYV